MRCPNCSKELEENTTKCEFCGQEFSTEARPMSAQEVSNYQGITLDEENSYERTEQDYRYEQEEPNKSRVYVKTVNMSGGLIGTVVFAILLVGLLFFVLPAFLLIGAAVAAIWFVFRMFAG